MTHMTNPPIIDVYVRARAMYSSAYVDNYKPRHVRHIWRISAILRFRWWFVKVSSGNVMAFAIECGPTGPRARYGAVQGDLRKLYDLMVGAGGVSK